MDLLAQVFALVGAGVHFLAFFWEVVVFHRPGVHAGIFRIPTGDVRATRMWAFNVGFYNLFLGAGAVAGVVAWWSGRGPWLVVYTCLFMFGAGIALAVSDRLAMSRPRGAGVAGALAQTVPPLVALVALAL
jgi:putative membrane protein